MIIIDLLFFILYLVVIIKFLEWSVKFVTKPISDYFNNMDTTTTKTEITKSIFKIRITDLKNIEEDNGELKTNPHNRLGRFFN